MITVKNVSFRWMMITGIDRMKLADLWIVGFILKMKMVSISK